MAFGIDFGTTNTAVCYRKTTKFGTTAIPYSENDQPFASLVALHPSKPPLFSREVRKRRSQLINEGYHVIASFKSILGTYEGVRVGDKLYSPVDITALFLSYVKSRVDQSATLSGSETLNEAVIAIPVDFSPAQRRDLRTAAERAGIKVLSFVSEPTAAYVSCRDEVPGAKNVAVFDWGGGTLDVSLVSIDGQEVSELAVAGKRAGLGGDDIDHMLAGHVHARIAARYGDARIFEDVTPRERDAMLVAAENAKIALSTDDEANITLLNYAGKPFVKDTITLDEFSGLIQMRVEEAVGLLFRATDKAGVSLDQMDALLMVGGSCEMQSICQRMEKICDEHHIILCHPDDVQWAVAAGAAVLSETDSRYRLQQGFGVLLSDNSFYPIFTAGQGVPCESSELRFGVVEDTRSAIFEFADERGNILMRQAVPIKGFTAEGIHLSCRIDEDLILQYEIHSDHAARMGVTGRINQLGFAYRIR